jgi:hypothetical protein
MDRPGDVDKKADNLGATRPWGVNEPLKAKELAAAVARLGELKRLAGSSDRSPRAASGSVSLATVRETLGSYKPKWAEAVNVSEIADPSKVTAGEFAQITARVLMMK